MGFWSSIGSAIKSGFNAVCSGVSNVVSKIGSGISTAVSGVANFVGKGLELVGKPLAKSLGEIAGSFLQGVDAMPQNQTVQQFGERALQAADNGITYEKDTDFDDYMQKINSFEVDPDKNHTENEALTAGLCLGTVSLEHKYKLEEGSLNNLFLLPLINSDYFDEKKLENLVEKSPETVKDVFDYLENNLDEIQETKFEDKLADVFTENSDKELNMKDKADLQDNLNLAKENFEKLQNYIKATEDNKES